MIYFDNAATTKPSEKSLSIFNKICADEYFNPSAQYSVGFDLFKKNNDAKKELLKILGSEEGNIIFTSGATESNNLAIFGSIFDKHKKYLFSMGEHPSVFNCALELKNKGYDVDFIPLQKNGQIDYEKFENLMTEDVCFVSTMLVSNETGAINDLLKIRKIIDCKNRNCVFHVDAVQGFCKIPFSCKDAKINLCSISNHKICGIKGVGALFVSQNTKLKNISYGGGQENNLRSGTINFAGNISFMETAKEAFNNLIENFNKVSELKKYLIEKLDNLNIRNLKIISTNNNDFSPYIISILFCSQRGETIMRFLSSKGIFVGTGSACSSSKMGNRILENMGYNKKDVIGAIRISFSKDNKKEEIDIFINALKECLDHITL